MRCAIKTLSTFVIAFSVMGGTFAFAGEKLNPQRARVQKDRPHHAVGGEKAHCDGCDHCKSDKGCGEHECKDGKCAHKECKEGKCKHGDCKDGQCKHEHGHGHGHGHAAEKAAEPAKDGHAH